ncbi:MAG: radical SAM protein [Muribaculaceae bacterium]|nr:radical SAM protein [Muribaculaceae bacterium]
MKFLLESNPAFLILPIDSGEYIFYNSLQHRASRLSELEMIVLDHYYKYQNKEFILSKIHENHREAVSEALLRIDKHKLLVCEELASEDYLLPEFPSSYYLHLTYRCNLSCSYCYNKNVRASVQKILSFEEWKVIIDKIAPYANNITLTGGEFFLYPYLLELLQYMKAAYPHIILSGISNGIHDFKKEGLRDVFELLSSISFSCDSIREEGGRKGFNPEIYKENILWLKNNYPNIKINIATTLTSKNAEEVEGIESFCNSTGCGLAKAILIPGEVTEIDLMPVFNEELYNNDFAQTTIPHLKPAAFCCGAGKSVCSIDPIGNVYPCQSLHFDEFRIGNLLNDSMADMPYIGKKGHILKSVNDYPSCSKCKVKYICGGGCHATGYRLYDKQLRPNHLTCYYNYINSIRQLRSLNNRL